MMEEMGWMRFVDADGVGRQGKGRRKHRIENTGGVCGCEGSGLMLDLWGGKGGLWVGGGLVDQSGRLANVQL